MDIIDIFRSFTKPDVWGEFLNKYKKLKPVPMPVRNTVFGAAEFWHDVSLPYSEIKDTTTNVPVVRRGSAAYALDDEGGEIHAIEPQGFVLSRFLTAARINNLLALGVKSQKAQFDAENNRMLRVIDKGVESMSSQALTGKVEYPMKADSGQYDVYELDFGSTETYSAGGLNLASTDTTLADVLKMLQGMGEPIEDNGYGGDNLTYAGKVAFSHIARIAMGNDTRNIAVTVTENEINVAGYKVRRLSGKYTTVVGGTPTTVPKMPDNALCMIDLDAGHRFFYLAIDTLKTGLKALPFFSKVKEHDDPEGAKIYGHSKPVPVPVVGAICWCTDAITA